MDAFARARMEHELADQRSRMDREVESLRRENAELRTALELQRQATEEAMRRAEEARRELADWKRANLLDALGRPHVG